jgi:hypothetical protein
MRILTKVLEEARVLQLRNGVTAREALAMAVAQQRRAGPVGETETGNQFEAPLQIGMPAASCLDSLLPRDREPTIAEIREAWKECMEQVSLYGEGDR